MAVTVSNINPTLEICAHERSRDCGRCIELGTSFVRKLWLWLPVAVLLAFVYKETIVQRFWANDSDESD